MKWRGHRQCCAIVEYPLSKRENFIRQLYDQLCFMLYGTKFWVVKKQHIHKMNVIEMRIPRWISENTQKYIIWNEEIRLKIGVAPINEKMRESLKMVRSYAEESD